MFYASPTSNITPALVSVAMCRTDSRDSTTSIGAFTSTPMTTSYSMSPASAHYARHASHTLARTITSSSSSSNKSFTSTIQRRDSATSWTPSPYASCMLHSSSSQGWDASSYLSDDDLLSLDSNPLPTSMPPMETIPSIQPQTTRKEMTTEEQIAMLREMQEKQEQSASQQRRPQAQRHVRFNNTDRKPRRSSNLSSRRGSSTRRSQGA